MIAQFLITDSTGKTRNFKLENGEYVVIGRSAKSCQVVINDDLSSSVHAKLQVANSEVIVEDLSSKNGTYVNGLKVLKQRIYLDDKIIIGDTALVFNLTKMDPSSKRLLKHSNPASRHDGSLTLELETALNLKANLSSRHTTPRRSKDSDGEYIDRSNLYKGVSDGNDKLKRNSKNDYKYLILSKLATVLDLSFAFCFGALIFLSSFLLEPKMAYKNFSDSNIEKVGYMDIIFSGDFILYTIVAIVGAFAFRVVNNRLPNGTFAERFLKIN